MKSSEYLETFVIVQAKKMQEHKMYLSSVMVLVAGIEVLGGFFDKKPLKSPKQSKMRFKVAIDRLFGGKYALANASDYLYEALRNQLLHSLLPGRAFQWNVTEKESHLLTADNVICFNPEVFLADTEKAVSRMKQLLNEGKAFEKKIPDNAVELLDFI